MPMILVADDSQLDRTLITEVLKQEPLDWLVEVVESAEEAISEMKRVAYDVVITDIMMSGLSGIDLLNHVHRQPHRVPVIVISGQDDQKAVAEAIRMGAASFVPKSELPSRLGETVRQVLEAAHLKRNYQALIRCGQEIRFKFKICNDPSLIQPFISLLQDMAEGMGILSDEARTRLGIAVDEAVTNAICHGNLELSEDEMQEVRRRLHAHEKLEAIADRENTAPYCERCVHLSAAMSHEGIKVVIRDEGNGFEPDSVAADPAHRGITLMQNLVDKVSYNPSGNEITLVKLSDTHSASKSAPSDSSVAPAV